MVAVELIHATMQLIKKFLKFLSRLCEINIGMIDASINTLSTGKSTFMQ